MKKLIILFISLFFFSCAEENLSLPVVETGAVSNVSPISALVNGNVTDDGGSEVIQRGVCWSQSADPTLENGHSDNGSGTGTFNASISALTPNTQYHVRAFATNADGTAYGADVTFTTLP